MIAGREPQVIIPSRARPRSPRCTKRAPSTRASGLGQAANGVGKIVGPLSLALIAGSSNVVSPQATSDVVLPAYLFLAFCMLLVGLSFVFLGVETHGKAMGVGDDERMIEPRGVALGAEPPWEIRSLGIYPICPPPPADSLRIQVSRSMRSAATNPSGWSSMTWCLASGTSTTGLADPSRRTCRTPFHERRARSFPQR